MPKENGEAAAAAVGCWLNENDGVAAGCCVPNAGAAAVCCPKPKLGAAVAVVAPNAAAVAAGWPRPKEGVVPVAGVPNPKLDVAGCPRPKAGVVLAEDVGAPKVEPPKERAGLAAPNKPPEAGAGCAVEVCPKLKLPVPDCPKAVVPRAGAVDAGAPNT